MTHNAWAQGWRRDSVIKRAYTPIWMKVGERHLKQHAFINCAVFSEVVNDVLNERHLIRIGVFTNLRLTQ